MSCTLIQERIVVGEALSEQDQAHVLGCPACTEVTQLSLALDSEVSGQLDTAVKIPDGFADRVMVALDHEQPATSLDRALGRRWVQVVLANVGLAVAVANIIRFVLGTLMPAAGLGGVR
jgi:hypothetical protein